MYIGSHELQDFIHGHPGGYELRYSLLGHPFYAWKQPVPRVSDTVLDCVIYLYSSVADAEAGEAVGGSGFLLGIPSVVAEKAYFLYAVTNSHVIREGASPIIRLNTKEGGKDVIELTEANWVHHQDGDDIAVCPLVLAESGKYQYKFVPVEMLLTKELVEQHNIGPGDDVYMAGRFVTHEGRQRNTPSLKFGNISMMPWEPIPHSRGIDQESFLVETRSLGGYSGSPVFVNIPKNITRFARDDSIYTPEEGGMWLLGVDWGHLPIYERVKEKNKKDNVPEGWVVESNSGQMAVIPAWRLRDLLDQEELAMPRRLANEELKKRQESSPVVLDMRTEHTQHPKHSVERQEPFTRDDFEDALDRASRRVPPSDPEK